MLDLIPVASCSSGKWLNCEYLFQRLIVRMEHESLQTWAQHSAKLKGHFVLSSPLPKGLQLKARLRELSMTFPDTVPLCVGWFVTLFPFMLIKTQWSIEAGIYRWENRIFFPVSGSLLDMCGPKRYLGWWNRHLLAHTVRERLTDVILLSGRIRTIGFLTCHLERQQVENTPTNTLHQICWYKHVIKHPFPQKLWYY